MEHRTTTDVAERDTRRQKVIYWIVSAPVLAETVAGIQWDFARNPTVVQVLGTLQFPDYFADVLGSAKCLALAALLVPGFPRLKEWAYAGLTFVYFGASVCHVLVGDSMGAVLTPFVLGVLGLASWALRPPSRRDPRPAAQGLEEVAPRSDDRSPRVLKPGSGHHAPWK